MEFFAKEGCRTSDHGLIRCPNRIASDSEATITPTSTDAMNFQLLSGHYLQ